MGIESSFSSPRRPKAVVLIFVLTVWTLLAFKLYNAIILDTSRQILSSKTGNSELKNSYRPRIVDSRDTLFNSIITEKEALMYEPCKNIKNTASINSSQLSFSDSQNGTYLIGDRIRAVIILHDSYGKRKHSGGDILRATIQQKLLSASAPCEVTDNLDGSHTLICEALWTGTSIITASLAYVREKITAIYRVGTQVLSYRVIVGQFRSRNYSQETPCHPNHTHLLKLTNYTRFCNLTYLNSGMPFYCGKPTDEHLLCQDLMSVKARNPYNKPYLTNCEKMLWIREDERTLKKTLKVNVKSRGNNKISVISKPTIYCSQYNVSLLWRSRGPTGFFYNGTWNLRNCLVKYYNVIKSIKTKHVTVSYNHSTILLYRFRKCFPFSYT
ncbi:NXPE family member 4-like [Mercenaria mercenaria]|uniref:NXPE family member 4-like n=1 Tax=Mercenaria mercenaria TaxID=6596 RepID=UPI00234F0BF5|nr:NXPE family member 4-like [Mercenaria mercenaria]